MDNTAISSYGKPPAIVWWVYSISEAEIIKLQLSQMGIQADVTSHGYMYWYGANRIGIIVRASDELLAREILSIESYYTVQERGLFLEDSIYLTVALWVCGGLIGLGDILAIGDPGLPRVYGNVIGVLGVLDESISVVAFLRWMIKCLIKRRNRIAAEEVPLSA